MLSEWRALHTTHHTHASSAMNNELKNALISITEQMLHTIVELQSLANDPEHMPQYCAKLAYQIALLKTMV